MNILVYNIAASETGALTVLNDFYKQVKQKKDNKTNWIFVVSTPELEETENIKVIRFPWIKKSRLHRLLFDYFYTRYILRDYKIDKIISLQNIVVPRTKIPQVVYVHQSIPFVEHRFKLSENWRSWVYQNLIGSKIISSIRRADKVVVQTDWMKEVCATKAGVDKNKIEVIPVKLEVETNKKFVDLPKNKKKFFYPAAGTQNYKNHIAILKACEILKQYGDNDYRVVFTFNGNENDHAMMLYKFASSKKLNVDFIGPVSRSKVFEIYSESVLIFPSYIETVGLPLLEAKSIGSPILVADCTYAHEVLNDYPNAYYFDKQSYEELANLMEKSIKNDLLVKKTSLQNTVSDQRKLIDVILRSK